MLVHIATVTKSLGDRNLQFPADQNILLWNISVIKDGSLRIKINDALFNYNFLYIGGWGEGTFVRWVDSLGNKAEGSRIGNLAIQ